MHISKIPPMFVLIAHVAALCYDQDYSNAIHRFVDQYKRTITTLEVGAPADAYSLELAKTYTHATCVMISNSTELLTQCTQHEARKQLILLQRAPASKDLQRLSACEHFDCVIATTPEPLDRMPWDDYIRLLTTLGDTIIISRPTTEHFMMPVVDGYQQEELIPNRLYVYKGHKESIARGSWLLATRSAIHIESNFLTKNILKTNPAWSHVIREPWVAGINLVTFKMYAGSYPTLNIVQQALNQIKMVKHKDWRPQNMILQGSTIIMIDGNDPRASHKNPAYSKSREHLLAHMCKWLAMSDIAESCNYYMHNMHRKYNH